MTKVLLVVVIVAAIRLRKQPDNLDDDVRPDWQVGRRVGYGPSSLKPRSKSRFGGDLPGPGAEKLGADRRSPTAPDGHRGGARASASSGRPTAPNARHLAGPGSTPSSRRSAQPQLGSCRDRCGAPSASTMHAPGSITSGQGGPPPRGPDEGPSPSRAAHRCHGRWCASPTVQYGLAHQDVPIFSNVSDQIIPVLLSRRSP